MKTITHWRAKRSGNCMTISGKDDQGAELTIPQVRKIERLYPDTNMPITVALLTGGENIVLA